MPRLEALQTSFTQGLLQDAALAVDSIRGDGLEPAARLALYRHHVFETLTDVLKAAYPVICRLVDDRFFAYAADHYIRQQPPSGPCLFEYGASFPHFLASFPACSDLLYLPDVAHLEWALHAAWYAEDAVPQSVECLAGFNPYELESLLLGFDPSVSYVSSPWPIDRIWRVNQPDVEVHETVSLESDPISLEVRRHDDEVVFRGLESGMLTFRAALAARQPLAEAFEAALAAAPDFCLPTALQAIFAEGLVVKIDTPGEKEAK